MGSFGRRMVTDQRSLKPSQSNEIYKDGYNACKQNTSSFQGLIDLGVCYQPTKAQLGTSYFMGLKIGKNLLGKASEETF